VLNGAVCKFAIEWGSVAAPDAAGAKVCACTCKQMCVMTVCVCVACTCEQMCVMTVCVLRALVNKCV